MFKTHNEPLRILIADDDPDELFVTSRILTKAGFSVELAGSGDEALEKIENSHPQLVLLDVIMPKVDGFEVCRQIKSNPLFEDISIVFVSNFSNSPATKAMGLNAGADDFIERPFNTEEFLSRINSIFRVKTMERKLKAQQEWMQVTLSSIGDALVATDQDRQIVFMNPMAEKLTGWTFDEARGRKFDSIISLFDETTGYPARCPLDQALSSGSIQRLEGEISLIDKNKHRFSISVSAAPIRLKHDHIVGGVMVFQDISRHKESEKALNTARENWEALFKAIGQVTLIMDAGRTILEVNDIAEEKLGIPRQEIIGKKCYELIHGTGSPPGGCPMNLVLKTKKQASAPLYMEKLQGDFLVTCTPVLNADQTVEKIIHIQTDISQIKQIEKERKALEEHLQQSQHLEAIGTLAGGIAHDFNNILSSILGFTELSLDDVKSYPELEENLQEIYTAGKRAKELVKQILTFARQTKEKKQNVSVGSIAKEVLKFIRSSSPTTIDIDHHIATKASVRVDPTRLHQLFMNLCTNAVQAMEDFGGQLKVAVTTETHPDRHAFLHHNLQAGEYVKISISDTGHGITQDIRDKIFEPYFTTKSGKEGTGLGLSTVHGIINDCGGHIHCESQPGQGTVFIIYLPKAASKIEQSEIRPDLPRGNEHILIVDDEPAIAKLEQRLLEHLGYRVTALTDSRKALDIFKISPDAFDLLLTDMTMPVLTGEELAKAVKDIRPDFPVILCTGFSKKVSGSRLSEMDVDEICMKPVLQSKLAASIRKLLDR
jgi:PAS domain S-box-containing protein